LFKSWSNLGFDQDSNGHKKSGKNEKIKKQSTYIAFLCHIYSKHSIKLIILNKVYTYSNQKKACIYPCIYIYNPILLSYEDVKDEEKWIWVSNMEISKTSQNMYISTPNPNLCLMKPSIWREVILGFKHGNFKNLPKASF